MKISQILQQDGYRLSFEVFPPKKSTGLENVRKATEEIAKLEPSFVSVTYGAGGGTSDFTLDIAKNIKEQTGVPVLAHITCVSSSREKVASYIDALKASGIENVMALRGDLTPEMESQDRSGWDYRNAYQLVEELKAAGDFCIGGACYPEVHPESSCRNEDILHLKEKVKAGCDFLTTQMFFDNDLFYSFLYRVRDIGIDVPVIPGIMPITNANQVEKALKLSGCHMPIRFTSLVDRFGSNAAAMQQAGIIYATEQIIDLYANGIRNVHVYTMNKPEVASGILNNVSAILNA
ncbi:MAG: methylenetetrahydrofolate reductase [Firmicutes bacterium]|nr:methylenetetrahydrofolate reductase [NAD(P)H] [Bacillota bacterium]MBQ2148044.1 methylenetetrahydrofolate reductase [NAD(P)H] [Bacillota bacterium]MBQ2228259.1 methylenetetrahydrofolate reductase [NAD(P)H] [Bacillota bacterium]MBR3395330.1 methylenetetrahydrofolate reductase [NAD(P)H] [Bacillota bacterium]MBR3718748.1 methylenetetrahydrofolate reductase [NAD(P)H] [Bacillota bacterium]